MTELGRRAFFARLLSKGAAAAETSLPTLGSLTFPKRQLGRTNEWVPILGIGTAGLGRGVGDDVAAMVLNRAVDMGVNYIDTAPDAGGYGRAQLQIARALAGRRKEYFLTTKLFEPAADGARRMLEANLEELRVDSVDLLYAHSLGHDKMDPDIMFAKGGVFDTLMEAKREGLTRFVGITGHNRPDRLVRALADYDIDVVMTAVNFADVHTYDFENRVLPFARARGVGIVAMKVFGGIKGKGHRPALMDEEHHERALRYALSLEGCATAVVGMNSLNELEENVLRARSFTPLTAAERQSVLEIGETLAQEWGPHLGVVD
jgi:predicted aldo/keto reductase-like oxidoreductase